jgi:hypothetical protein
LQPIQPLPLRWCFDQLIRYPKATLIDVGANTGSFTLMIKTPSRFEGPWLLSRWI